MTGSVRQDEHDNDATALRAAVADALAALRQRRPLVHCITNDVVMNVTANALLAAGAVAVMAHAPEEVADITAQADALLVNLGTPTPARAEAMRRAVHVARNRGRPIVLDPVGVGASPFRATLAADLLPHATILRGNAGELRALAGIASAGRGVEADPSDHAEDAAATLAARLGITVALTGPVDVVIGPGGRWSLANGHPWLMRMTGAGCIAGALIAAMAGAGAAPPVASVAGLTLLNVAAERAAARAEGPGTFQPHLIDALAALAPAELATSLRFPCAAPST